ncbi:MAG: outer membrane protein assembly factor BamD [Gammaproteobacteria bacterium]|nr:MAG: outer membrane protein assembly factor BamD [Gammaproteobacteria bacterium]
MQDQARASLKPLLLATICLILSACASTGDKDPHSGWSAEHFYKEAKTALDDEDYRNAIELYEKLEARYPFGKYANQAQLEIAFAYYKYDEPESAIAAVDRYIRLHPSDPHVAYALYLRGLVNYNRGIGFLERFIPTDSSQRDPGSARHAFADFSKLVTKYPDSEYAHDARQRMIALRNNLAKYEVHAARYYIKRKAFLAAANRGNYVVEKYQKTTAIPEALEIMIHAYEELGMDGLASDARRVYQINYADGLPDTGKPQSEETLSHQVLEFFELDKD